ncbi:MAG: Crp/Fnr family transcriptional regulator, partial [Ferruginibacter sp.]|nr:Crp/Fnr family transcriptional regulator [Cytophagales bacterium]
MQLKNLLETLNRFITLSEEQQGDIQRYFEPLQLNRHDFFLSEGQVCNRLAFVEKGMLRHFYHAREEEVTRWISFEGSFASSLSSFLRRVPSVENIQAIESSTIYCLSRSHHELLYAKHPAFRELWRTNLEEYYIRMEERIYSTVGKTAEERYEDFLAQYP